MKKFSSITESNNLGKYYKVKAEVNIVLQANNEGEAAYIVDSTLSSIKNQSSYDIKNIEETTKEEENELSESVLRDPFGRPFISTEDDDVWEKWDDQKKMKHYWEAMFGERHPNSLEKMEFYHVMRKNNIDKELIYKFITKK